MLVVLNALLKSIKPQVQNAPKVRLAFRVPGRYAHRLRCRKGESFALEVDFFGADLVWCEAWQAAMHQHLATNPHAGFDLVGEVEWNERSFTFAHHDEAPAHAELEFLAPLPFKRAKGTSRTQLDLTLFMQQLQRRAEQLLGVELEIPALEAVKLQSNHWNYTELRHHSKSQPGHTQYFNGCFGSLYFSGDLRAILPWLELAQAIHAGGSVELNPLGYCRLHTPARPRYDELLVQPTAWQSAILKLQESHDDWMQQAVAEQGAPFNAENYSATISSSVLQSAWQPAPSQAYAIPKRNGLRRVEKLPHAELLLHTVLHELLNEPIDRVLEKSAVGFRRGHSVQSAVAQVQEYLEQGYRYVVESDIEDFFPAIAHARMEALLDETLPPADDKLRQLISKLLRTPFLEHGQLKTRRQGLAQGSPLSPLFANLYLDRFDEAFNELDAKLVRYADDFIILARSAESAQTLLDLAREELAEVGLELNAEKTAIRTVEEGFRFLGQPFGGAAENTLAELLVTPAQKTIYITEPGCFLGHNGDALEIRRNGALEMAVPLRRVSDIAILAPASLSSGIIQRCAKLGIPLTMALGDGYHIASLAPDSRRYHNIAAAQALHYDKLTDTERLILAKSFAAGKIANYKPLISARHTQGSAELLQTLDDCIAGIESAPDISAVRGHEGRAAKLMFATLNSYIKVSEFNFKKRNRDNPDRMNVLFNFGYYLLFSRLNTMVRAAGLNPYLGFLHDGADDYETLVCDIEELFRAPLDRHLIALVNLRIIKASDIEAREGKMKIAPLAVKRFLHEFEKLLHSDAGGVTLLEAMQAQVQAFVRHVTQGKQLWYFAYRSEARQPEQKSEPVEVNDDESKAPPFELESEDEGA